MTLHRAPVSRTLVHVLIGWNLVGGTLRCVWFLTRGQFPDALPFITLALGVGALLWLYRPASWHRRAPSPPAET